MKGSCSATCAGTRCFAEGSFGMNERQVKASGESGVTSCLMLSTDSGMILLI